jgi:hypothetical protein
MSEAVQARCWGTVSMKRRTIIAAVAFAVSIESASARSLTEQQARVAAAQFVKGFGFGPNGGQVIQVPDAPAADRSVAEIAGHLSLALLIVRGETGYCGPIREPTWVFIWNTEESAAWNGGYPVMINARTGKVLDCRS